MKKILLFLILFTTIISKSQTIIYQANNVAIANPEKGFYKYTSTGSSGGYNLLSQSTLTSYRNNENITVIQRQFFLRDFITGIPITTTPMFIANAIIKNTGSTARAMQTDYFMYEEIFTNPR